MGKQNRKKHRHRGSGGGSGGSGNNKNEKDPSASSSSSTSTSNNNNSNNNNNNAVVKRLRHVDRQVRLATLLGLQSTLLLGSDSSNNSSNNKLFTMDILQAVREQIMDHSANNLECAIAASECIVQYLKNNSNNNNLNNNDNNNNQNDTTSSIMASWSVIFIGRLEQCYNAIQQLQQTQTQQQHHHGPSSSLSHWYALTVPCLQALCYLVETNPIALQQVVMKKMNMKTKTKDKDSMTFLDIIVGLIHNVLTYYKQQQEQQQQQPGKGATAAGGGAGEEDSIMTESTEATSGGTPATNADITMDKTKKKKRNKKKKGGKNNSNNNATNNNKFASNVHELVRLTSIYSCRILHSSLDDNHDLAYSFLSITTSTSTSTTTAPTNNTSPSSSSTVMLYESIQWSTSVVSLSSSPSFPTIAKLHLIGSFVTAIQQVVDATNKSHGYWMNKFLSVGILYLLNELDINKNATSHEHSSMGDVENSFNSSDTMRRLHTIYGKYLDAYILSQQQLDDDKLERDIVRKQNQKRESAREIARRQKNQERPVDHIRDLNQQVARKVAASASAGAAEVDIDDKEMEDVHEQQGEEEGDSKKEDEYVRPPDGQQAMEDALRDWNSLLDPFELALEVSANLVSCLIPKDENDEDGDEMMMMTDNHQQHRSMSVSPVLERSIQTLLVQGNLSNRLLKLLQQVCTLKSTLLANTTSQAAAGGVGLLEDLDNITSKVSACVVNCILSHSLQVGSNGGDSNTTTIVDPNQFWQNLKPYIRNDGTSSILAVAVQHSPRLRQVLISSSSSSFELDFLLGELDSGAQTPNDVTRKMQRDIVTMLASSIGPAVSTGPDAVTVPSEIVTKIASSFLRVLQYDSSSVDVACEVLNALMDIFSEDDLYDDIFRKLNVLMHFENGLANCMQSLQQGQQRSDEQSMDMDEEQEDVLFNAQRFVEYKQQTTTQGGSSSMMR